MKKKIISWQIRFLILLGVIVVCMIGGILWWNDGLSPVDKLDTETIEFTVKPGEQVRDIANKLTAQRLIRSRTVFFLLVKMKGIDNRIQAGDFRLSRSMTTDKIADELTHGASDVWITTLEGWRIEEIASKLAIELKIPEREFLSYAKEGYMFPDTYLIPKNSSGSAVAKIFLINFTTQFDKETKENAIPKGFSKEEIVVLASLVEREGRSLEDKRMIAGILFNRLAIDMKLDIDATLQYAIGYDSNEKTWWKKNLTNEDKKTLSPYNTYLNKGLPSSPISNPGIVSIRAVLNPEKSDYLYYLHDSTGKAHYAKTLDQHESNVQNYLN